MTAPPMVLDFINYVVRRIESALGVDVPVAPGTPPAPGGGGPAAPRGDQRVIAVANKHSGGGFNAAWAGDGYPEAFSFKDKNGKTFEREAAVGGTYCCGFTLGVVLNVASERGLLKDKTRQELSKFEVEWYGTTIPEKDRSQAIYYQQCALALENLGIGTMVEKDPNSNPANLPKAQPGDFVQFWRGSGAGASGHSVIFLDWVKGPDGEVLGIKYRSTQSSTDGIGDRIEYFKGAKDENGKQLLGTGQDTPLNPNATFAGRLDTA
jgi:hypothetical protein